MLRSLSIRNVVLIDSLDLGFHSALGVLTGETGAGKSILLDALALALGIRAEARLVGNSGDQATVTAEFEVALNHAACGILNEHGIDDNGGALLLRRILSADGRSRAFANDQPVSVALLRQLGDLLVEVHGQFESQRLLDTSTHRKILDNYGELSPVAEHCASAWDEWQRIALAKAKARTDMEKAKSDEDYLRHAADELAKLDPQPGEEEKLASRRTALMHGEKIIEAMNQAAAELNSARGVEDALRAAMHSLEQVADKADGCLDGTIAALAKAVSETVEGTALLDKAAADMDVDHNGLESVEERLFALRALARKHRIETTSLPFLRNDLMAQVAALENGEAALQLLKHQEAKARASYIDVADNLRQARKKAAVRLDAGVVDEMQPLKLGAANFVTLLEPLDEGTWNAFGMDRVLFQVSTNPEAPLGALKTIASGGELARFMLALKVVLAASDAVPTIIFDEVDSGIGGAVATAVGERLIKLADDFQVLVVTHSPQVAACGQHHMYVSKTTTDTGAITSVVTLDDDARKEEIARMLAGSSITDEARAAAASLLHGATV